MTDALIRHRAEPTQRRCVCVCVSHLPLSHFVLSIGLWGDADAVEASQTCHSERP